MIESMMIAIETNVQQIENIYTCHQEHARRIQNRHLSMLRKNDRM